MAETSDSDILLHHLPFLKRWYCVILLYSFQLIIFMVIMFFLWWISSNFFYGAILGQSILSTFLSLHFIYIAKYSEKIRNKYRQKYGDLAFQYYWLKYHSCTVPAVCAAFYFPLLLAQYEFLPVRFVCMPAHPLTRNLFPFFVSIPIGISIVIVGYLIKKPSGGYGKDIDNYLYEIYPEKSKLLTTGTYKFIRNPQYLGRGVIAVGFGVIANNISAIVAGFIHLLSYCIIIPAEDRELIKRFGKDFIKYKSEVPAILPKFGNWIRFFREICRRGG